MDDVFARHDSLCIGFDWRADQWLRYGGESVDQLADWTTLLTLGDAVSERKLRLFLCACGRHIWDGIEKEPHRQTVEVGERFADGQATEEERAASHRLASLTIGAGHHATLSCARDRFTVKEARSTAKIAAGPRYKLGSREKDTAFTRHNQLHYALLLRDVFGDTLRPLPFDSRWRPETALALAAGIYDEKAFDRLPILADALEEAGCDSAVVLNHCRSDHPHVRGCWVIDRVLGKV